MRKSKKFLAIATLSVCALSLLAACKGCGDEEKEDGVFVLPPEITATDEGLYWTKATGAESYKYRFGDGEYQKAAADERSVEYPTETGDYVFEIYSVGDGEDSESVKFAFSVKCATPSATVVDNVVTFTGDNIYYSVDGGEESALTELYSLDFSAAEVGKTYTVSYYSKGGFWSEQEKAYYVDSAKQSVSVTVGAVLSAPTLTVTAGGLIIGEVAGATGYEVKIDGAVTVISGNQIAFPETVGEHVISVRAIGGGGYRDSAERVFEMQTKERGVPSVTYSKEENTVAWSKDYIGLMTASTGDEFEEVTGGSIAVTDGLRLRLNSAYDEESKTYYLTSKSLSIAKRTAPQITFTKEGTISWNPTDEGEALTYFVSFTQEGEEFVEARSNFLNVSEYAAGRYSFKVYGGQYLSEDDESATFYLPGFIGEISLRILQAPKLDFTTGKLLWEKDGLAFGYEYKTGSGEWETAGMSGEISVSAFDVYAVRAVGNETEGNYVVSSLPSQIVFDPALRVKTLSSKSEELATFNAKGYENYTSAPIAEPSTGKANASVLTEGQDAEEQAILAGANGGVLKITATSKAPKNTNLWGNSDGVHFTLFKAYELDADKSITFRVYMKSNELRTTTGWLYPDKETTVDLEGRIAFSITGVSVETGLSVTKTQYFTIATDTWVDYTWLLAGYDGVISAITGVEVFFQNVGKEGDVIYLDEVAYNSPVRCDSDVVRFNDNPAYKNAVLYAGANGVELIEDTIGGNTVQVLHAISVYQKYDVSILYDNLALYEGDKIKVTMKVVSEAENGGSISLNGVYRADFSSVNDEWVTYSVVVEEDGTLSSISLHAYDPRYVYEIYVESICIERYADNSPIRCDSKTLDFNENPQYKRAVAFEGSGVELIEDTIGGNTVQVLHAISVYQKYDVTIAYDSLALSAGDTVTIVLKAASEVGEAGNGGGIYFNGAHVKNFTSTASGEWVSYTITVAEDLELDEIKFHVYNPGYVYELYIASIVVS